uniref:Uncharacterized protein n=1 Tax=Oryza nivara TaxID=4536 RepID=A0A0E0H0Q1_ORYNI
MKTMGLQPRTSREIILLCARGERRAASSASPPTAVAADGDGADVRRSISLRDAPLRTMRIARDTEGSLGASPDARKREICGMRRALRTLFEGKNAVFMVHRSLNKRIGSDFRQLLKGTSQVYIKPIFMSRVNWLVHCLL